MNDTLHVRPAVASDAEAIGQAHATAWVAAYDHAFDWDFLLAAASGRRIGWERAIERTLLPPDLLLVGEMNRRVVAFAHSRPIATTAVEVLGFYCHPVAWGSGIAALLMEQIAAALPREVEDLVLWTLRDAARARHFYENAGFTATGDERAEVLTDWCGGASHERTTVKYRKRITTDRA